MLQTAPVLRALRIPVLISTLAFPATALSESLQSCDFGQRSQAGPAELDQYAFLIGNWDILSRSRKPDGTWREGGTAAYWEGRWILGGTAIADYWYDQPPAEGVQPGRGVNVRMYRPEAKQWSNMWQHSGLNEVRTLTSEVRDDGKMHMWASHPDTSKQRRMRFEVESANRWVRVEEWSRDGGDNWFEVSRLEATRAPCPWRPTGNR